MNKELKEILFDDAQVVASCNTINTIDELHIILQKINWMNKSHKLYREVYKDGRAIRNKNNSIFFWSEDGLKYLKSIINSEYKLSSKLNIEFIVAKYDLSHYIMDRDPTISRELARALYMVNNRKLIYNDNAFTTFTINEYGVYVAKYNNKAMECYLVSSQFTDISITSKEFLSDYFYDIPTEDDDYKKFDCEDDEYGTVNGKVYLSDGVWIDRKDVWW